MMTELLERVIARMRALPADDQDAMAQALLSAMDDGPEPEPLDEAARSAIREGLAQAGRGEFASEAEIASLWRRHGL